MNSELHLNFALLDRQIVDRDGGLVGKVDDVELSDDDQPRVTALLVGALGRRLGGWFAPVRRKQPIRIPWNLVDRIESEICLTVRRDELPAAPLETWLRERLIGRIPGARE